jgi:trimethylamine:corrinoid methyltransferase-like protein
MFDLGYCYEQLDRDQDALRMYQRYIAAIRASDPDAAARAEERIQGLTP